MTCFISTINSLIHWLNEKEKVKIYLGIPFSHPDLIIQEFRYRIATEISGRLLYAHHIVYSPITHYWPQVKAMGIPEQMKDLEFWIPYNDAFLKWADLLVIVSIDNWAESVGVRYEIDQMIKMNKEIVHLFC